MAAVEIWRIADKFLRNTSIPFVSPQFSYCVYIAAKVLLGKYIVIRATPPLTILTSHITLRWSQVFCRIRWTLRSSVADIKAVAAEKRFGLDC